jgi:hypothetical protein
MENIEIGTCVMCRKRKAAYYFNCEEGSSDKNVELEIYRNNCGD